jgi:hypothetical protein
MSRNVIRAGVLLCALVVAMPALAWKLVEEGTPFVHKTGYSIQYPSGWRWVKRPFGDETTATRDGIWLQQIFVDFRKHKNAFPALKKAATPEMMPQELAEKYVANMTAAGGLQEMEILSNEPTVLGGRPGFRVHLAYRSSVDAGSVRYQAIVVGANSPQGIFLVGYDAAVLHYFARDVEAFEKSLGTFAIADKPAKQ